MYNSANRVRYIRCVCHWIFHVCIDPCMNSSINSLFVFPCRLTGSSLMVQFEICSCGPIQACCTPSPTPQVGNNRGRKIWRRMKYAGSTTTVGESLGPQKPRKPKTIQCVGSRWCNCCSFEPRSVFYQIPQGARMFHPRPRKLQSIRTEGRPKRSSLG